MGLPAVHAGQIEGVAEAFNAAVAMLHGDSFAGYASGLVPDFVSGSSYALNAFARSGGGQVYECITAVSSTLVDPAVDPAHWRLAQWMTAGYKAPLSGAASIQVASILQQVLTTLNFGGKADGDTDDSGALARMLAACAFIRLPYGVTLGHVTTAAVLGAGLNYVVVKGMGAGLSILRMPAGVDSNVLECGETAQGNASTAYAHLDISDLTVDGNRANTPAPAGDLTGWGIPLTNFAYWSIKRVVCINCWQGGFGTFIHSDYGQIDAVCINCGNAAQGTPGYDINSSSYIQGQVICINCFCGARSLDNCFNNKIKFIYQNATSIGFIYNNQLVNESSDNQYEVLGDTSGSHAVDIGPNCFNSRVTANVTKAGAQGCAVAQQTVITNGFDGSNAAVVSVSANTIALPAHGLSTGYKIAYNPGAADTPISGIAPAQYWYVIVVDANTIKLAATKANAFTGTAVALAALGTGSSHALTFDPNSTGNQLRLATSLSAAQGLFMGGNHNDIVLRSKLDGRAGPQGSWFACEVVGSNNTFHVDFEDTPIWQMRGFVYRNGANYNRLLSYQSVNVADLYNDGGGGIGNSFTRGDGFAPPVTTLNPVDPGFVGNIVPIATTGTINFVTPGFLKGQRVTLVFSGPTEVLDASSAGGNVLLAGHANQNFTANSTLTLTSTDGINCLEVNRTIH